MRSRSMRPAVLFLILLCALAGLKWRADHPPLSSHDLRLRATLSQVPWVYICGTGKPWQALTGLSEKEGMLLTGKDVRNEVAETLRLSGAAEGASDFANKEHPPLFLSIMFPSPSPKAGRFSKLSFSYVRTARGSFFASQHLYSGTGSLSALKQWQGDWAETGDSVTIRPQFASQFEAPIKRLVQDAKAPGEHREIGLRQWGSI